MSRPMGPSPNYPPIVHATEDDLGIVFILQAEGAKGYT